MRNWCIVAAFALAFASCSPNNVTVDNSLQKFFDDNHARGTFGIYNNGTSQFTVYNLSRFKDSVYLPGASFDIVTSLAGLETGKIRDEKMALAQNGSDTSTAGRGVTMQ